MYRKLENQPTLHKNKLSGHESKKTHSDDNKDCCKHFLFVRGNVAAWNVGRTFPFIAHQSEQIQRGDGGTEWADLLFVTHRSQDCLTVNSSTDKTQP